MHFALLFFYAYGNTEEFAISVYALIVKQSQCVFACIVSGYNNAVFFEIREREDRVALMCPLGAAYVYRGTTAGDLNLYGLTRCKDN